MNKEKTTNDPTIDGSSTINGLSTLILHNDDNNSFDHVIDCLVMICDHNAQQAEQCAMIVHNKGKCDVRSGEREAMLEMRRALVERKLNATVE